MTDPIDKKDKETKLRLGGTRLSLNRNISQPTKPNTVINSNSNTIIEVKKSKLVLNNLNQPFSLKKTTPQDHHDKDDVNARVNLIKKAANEITPEHIPGNLTKIVALNQVELEKPLEQPIILTSEEKSNEEKIIEVPPVINEKIQTSNIIDNVKISDKVIAKAVPIKPKSISTFEETPAKDIKKSPFDNKVVPVKKFEDKKLKKTDIIHMLDTDENNIPLKTRSIASLKRARAKEKRKLFEPAKVYREVIIPENITVGELANRMSERASEVIKILLDLGIIANVNQSIDGDTAELVVSALGHSLKRIQASDVENVIDTQPDQIAELFSRAPVVTVVGHVDHGKTLLLDAIRSVNTIDKEAGGITQHIGAYKVKLDNDKTITFIDTPGHEAFTAMRTRGVEVTDIVILVVAADDGIKAQTIEAINHAKAAKVPIIVAINKIDKEDIDIDRVKNELLTHNLVAEDYGGDTIIVPISALKMLNIDKLLEAVLLVAEMLELKANPVAPASGVIIESRIDKGQGIVISVLVKRGSLKLGDLIVAGTAFGKVKKMLDDRREPVIKGLPSDPLEIYGLNESPMAGDKFDIVKTEKQARDIIDYRKNLIKDKKNAPKKIASLESLFDKVSGKSNIKELKIIIKADVQGSVEAIDNSLMKIISDEVIVKVLHSGIGGITESDVTLAKASGAMIVGFNVRAASGINQGKEVVDIRYYSIIYDLIDDVKLIMSGMLSPIIREIYIGSVDIREVFNITKVGKIAGCYVTRGVIKKGAGVRLLRENIVIHQGKLKTLKRFTDEVKEVKEGFECGIAFENYEDLKIGDKLEVYEIVEEKKHLPK